MIIKTEISREKVLPFSYLFKRVKSDKKSMEKRAPDGDLISQKLIKKTHSLNSEPFSERPVLDFEDYRKIIHKNKFLELPDAVNLTSIMNVNT